MYDPLVYASPRLPLFCTGVADGAARGVGEDDAYADRDAELDSMYSATDGLVREDDVEDAADDEDDTARVADVAVVMVDPLLIGLSGLEDAYRLLR